MIPPFYCTHCVILKQIINHTQVKFYQVVLNILLIAQFPLPSMTKQEGICGLKRKLNYVDFLPKVTPQAFNLESIHWLVELGHTS